MEVQSIEKLSTVTYTSDSKIRSPIILGRAMLHDLLASREVAWQLAVRDVLAQYRKSMLGLFWAFIPPLASGLLFIVLQQKKLVNIPDPGMPYALFVLIGTTLWQIFVEAVNAPLRIVTNEKAVLAKINFPREALILSALYQTLFGLLIRGVIIVGVLIWFDVPFGGTSLLALVPIVLLVWLGIAIGLMITPVGMLITDVSAVMLLVLQLGFFLTPVIYPAPQTFPYSLLATLNPVSPYLIAARDLLVQGTIDNLMVLVVLTGILLLGSLFAWFIYRVSMPILIERISA